MWTLWIIMVDTFNYLSSIYENNSTIIYELKYIINTFFNEMTIQWLKIYTG